MVRTRQRGEGGFSLLEVFVSLLILSIGVFGLAMVQMNALTVRNPLATSRLSTAIGLAQATLDRFQRIPWDALRSSHPDGFRQGADGTAPAFSMLAEAAGDSVFVQGTRYFRVWRVTRDPEIPALKTISVWCCWRQGEAWRQVVLVTQRADVGA
ncbi:MAG: hypothetical protein M0Z38_03825 [Deltaproteobacteria bacterium]|nr:hypothetical protein [Deltaproteobacteria bacterium]